ncbi:methyltransferase [Jonesia quinghaiensis]|uniref:methyltransferase n=1 Tax=Jonesia quinghaiensis TaxID=262806 RepID=UPI0004213532|nr:hypothetical protein [Jonesia quinghaiensis]
MATQQMLSGELDDVYYSRMASSLGDKVAILDHILPGNIVDVGSGGGELGAAIAQAFPTSRVVGIDPFPYPHSAIPVLEGYADELLSIVETPVDTIVASSILHEVFSYGNRDALRGSMRNIDLTLRVFHQALAPGGRLIIRDGVTPDNPESLATMTLLNPEDDAWVERYLAECPFAQPGYDRTVALVRRAPGVWEGTIHSLTEFAFTYTWGAESFARESQEFYTAMSEDDYVGFAHAVGFTVIHSQQYVQPGYIDHLHNRLTFSFPFPATNALYVLDKTR